MRMPQKTRVRHGTKSMYTYGCRCAECRAEIRAYATQRRRAAGIRTWDEYVAEIEPPHGTASRYSNRGCRCEDCRRGHNERIRAYYSANLAHPKPIPEHGTESRYSRGCRCDSCRAAMTEARRRRRRNQALVAA